MAYKYSLILFVILIFFSCSRKSFKEVEVDGIRTISNNKANDEKFSIDIEKKFIYNLKEIIPDSTSIIGVDFVGVSDSGRIYVLDYKQYKIHIIGEDGNYINSFGSKGIGPFEFSGRINVVVINDKVIVTSTDQAKSMIFDANGNPLKEKIFKSSAHAPANPILSGNYIVSYNYSSSYDRDTEEVFNIRKIMLFDNELNNIAIVSDTKTLMNTSKPRTYGSLGVLVCLDSKNRIYKSKESFTHYEFEVFDTSMSKLESISKSCRSIPYSETEKKKVINWYKDRGIKFNYQFKNKQLISNIFSDKYDRVWIKPALEEDEKNVYDIFKDGIYINRIKLKLESNYFIFSGNYLYEIDTNNFVISKCTYN